MTQQQPAVNPLRDELARSLQVWKDGGGASVAVVLDNLEMLSSLTVEALTTIYTPDDGLNTVQNLGAFLCAEGLDGGADGGGASRVVSALISVLFVEIGRDVSNAYANVLKDCVDRLPPKRVLDALKRDALTGGGAPAPIYTVPNLGENFKKGGQQYVDGLVCREDLSEQDRKYAEAIEKALGVELTVTTFIFGHPR